MKIFLAHVWIGSIEDKSNLANPQIHQTKSLPNIEPNNKVNLYFKSNDYVLTSLIF